MDGVEATRRITSDDRLSSTRVVILTTFDLDEYVFDALRAGASGFLLKDTLPAELLAAVRRQVSARASLGQGERQESALLGQPERPQRCRRAHRRPRDPPVDE